MADKQLGFTLIELVITILLIAIMSVTALPKLISQSSYSAYSLRNEFISAMRLVQLRAINNVDRCYRLSVSPTGYQVSRFSSSTGTTCTGTAITPDPLTSSTFEGGAQLVLISNSSNTFDIDFDIDGRLSLSCTDNCIQVVADDIVIINVSSEGYIYAD